MDINQEDKENLYELIGKIKRNVVLYFGGSNVDKETNQDFIKQIQKYRIDGIISDIDCVRLTDILDKIIIGFFDIEKYK